MRAVENTAKEDFEHGFMTGKRGGILAETEFVQIALQVFAGDPASMDTVKTGFDLTAQVVEAR